ncbi:MAG: hypothetical protein U5K76_15615 [Woeseiaceae bacterium]|nr:hypothetical protein [Woeseiaceae bacterium]
MRNGARATILAVLLPGMLQAAGDEAAVERCRAADSAAERIACLEAALMGESAAAAAPGGEATAESARPEPPSRQPAAAPAPGPQSAGNSSASPAPAAPARANGAQSPNEEQIGAEQLPRDETRDEKAAKLARASGLAVASYEHVPYRRLLVSLENGQAWLQIEGDTQYVRASLRKNRTVDIEESNFGGYKLRLNEMRRTIRVQRIR